MTDTINAERAVGRENLNPLNHVVPTLERLGIAEAGRHDFDVAAVDATIDIVSLGQEDGAVVLAVYLKPQPCHEQPEFQRVRSHIFYQLTGSDPVYVRSDVLRCARGGNHPLEQEYIPLDEVKPTQVGHFEGVKRFAIDAVSRLQPIQQIDLDESAERLGKGCEMWHQRMPEPKRL